MSANDDDSRTEEHKRLAGETFKVGNEMNFERGDWQLSRVYAVLGRGSESLHYARRCLDTCLANEIADFDLAFAYEAMARAHAVTENWTESERYIELAKVAAKGIAKDEDKEYFLGELGTVPSKP
jgi:hypothetical protein